MGGERGSVVRAVESGSIQQQGGEVAGGTCDGGIEECVRLGRKLLGSESAGPAC